MVVVVRSVPVAVSALVVVVLDAAAVVAVSEVSADVVVTVGTDSMEMYGSRLEELNAERGEFTALDAAGAYHRYLLGAGIDHVHELGYYDRKRIHNLKYYTWVEQQGKTYDEIQAQWYDEDYWTSVQALIDPIDELIEGFNARVAG